VLHELFKENTYLSASRRGWIVVFSASAAAALSSARAAVCCMVCIWPTASPTWEMPELYSILANVISATMSSGAWATRRKAGFARFATPLMSNYKGFPQSQANIILIHATWIWAARDRHQPTWAATREEHKVRTGTTTSGHRTSCVYAADPDARCTRGPHSL